MRWARSRINSGSYDSFGTFGSDGFVTGGWEYVSTATVATNGVANAAPAEIYQSERYGQFSYTLGGYGIVRAGAHTTALLDAVCAGSNRTESGVAIRISRSWRHTRRSTQIRELSGVGIKSGVMECGAPCRTTRIERWLVSLP